MFTSPRGDFVALTHGDDYWTSPHKLQRQVDALRFNAVASGCFARCGLSNHLSGEKIESYLGPWFSFKEPIFSLRDLLAQGNFVPTPTMCFRRASILPVPAWLSSCPVGDFPLAAIAASKGPLVFLDEVVATYNIHPGGVHGPMTQLYNFNRYWKTYEIIGREMNMRKDHAFRVGVSWVRWMTALAHRDEGNLVKALMVGIPVIMTRPRANIRDDQPSLLARTRFMWHELLDLSGVGSRYRRLRTQWRGASPI